MFLNNFFKILALNHIGGGNYYIDSAQISSVTGTYYRIASYGSGYCAYSNIVSAMAKTVKAYNNSNDAAVYFGNGSAAVSADDFRLSGSLITTFSNTYKTTVTADASGITYSTLYTITNTSSSDNITISEIGMSMRGYYCNSVGTNIGEATFLVERTLLDTPITIAPNGVGQVTYTIRINYPVL